MAHLVMVFSIVIIFLQAIIFAKPIDVINLSPKYYFGENMYVVIKLSDLQVVFELRKKNSDQLIQEIELNSRYCTPEYEARDVAFDKGPEFLIYTRGGGTGISATQLTVIGFLKGRLRSIGSFDTEREYSWGNEYEELLGAVSFLQDNGLLYQYTQVNIQDGLKIEKNVLQTFIFNFDIMKYEKTKETITPIDPVHP